MSVVDFEPSPAELSLEQAAAIVRDRLLKRLALQREHVARMLAWYEGRQDPPGLPRDATGQLYRRIRESSRSTWASLIVDAIAERLEAQGYRSSDRELAARAWELWQANRLDDEQRQVYVDALIAGRGYVLVTPPDEPDAPPAITPESPLEVTHEWEPGGRRRVRAGLKAFPIGEGWWRAELYGPDLVLAWEGEAGDDRERHPFGTGRGPFVDVEPEIAANELDVVPVVPFENRRTTSTGPLSEIEQVEHTLRRVDELLCGRQVAAHFQAFRQRWATGLEVPRDPETGKPVEPFSAAVQKLWIAEDPDARFGSFEQSDLGQYTRAIESEVAELAAISRVPAHYFVHGELANPPSAESLTASEAGLVQKCRDRQKGYGESWELALRLALALDGVPADRVRVDDELLWRDPAVRSPAQVADAATKWKDVGVPREALWSMIGATPQQVELWRTMAAEDELRAALAAPVE